MSEAENEIAEPHEKKVKLDEPLATSEHENSEIVLETDKTATSSGETTKMLSKRQMKKLKKLQDWETKKKEKRLKEREKYRQKRLEAIARGEPGRKGPSRKELKRNKIDEHQCKYTIAVDLSFDELMIDKDIAKCVKQLLRVYTINRRSKMPINLYFTGMQPGNRLHQTLERNDGYKNWDVKMRAESFLECFDRDRIVYLTSDSDNVLDELDSEKIYIIGGLVDHNHNKGHCHQIAVDGGINHARLPLNENVLMKTRTVLSIFHGMCGADGERQKCRAVFEILLKKSEGESWQDAILHVIPQRKGAKPKCALNSKENSNDSEKCDDDDDNLNS